ncbi:MAG: HEAT repeat domain-containing protein [Promethearchaeota archaeon]
MKPEEQRRLEEYVVKVAASGHYEEKRLLRTIRLLGKVGDASATSTILRLLESDPPYTIRSKTIQILTTIENPNALDTLLESLETTRNEVVRGGVVLTLLKTRGSAGFDLITERVQWEQMPQLGGLAHQLAYQLAELGLEDPRAFEVLRGRIMDEQDRGRGIALEALREVRDPRLKDIAAQLRERAAQKFADAPGVAALTPEEKARMIYLGKPLREGSISGPLLLVPADGVTVLHGDEVPSEEEMEYIMGDLYKVRVYWEGIDYEEDGDGSWFEPILETNLGLIWIHTEASYGIAAKYDVEQKARRGCRLLLEGRLREPDKVEIEERVHLPGRLPGGPSLYIT